MNKMTEMTGCEIIDEKLISVEVGGRRYTFRALFERDEDGWIIVECPALDGCFTQGKDMKEAVEMIKDAMQLMIEVYIEDGDQLPQVEYRRKRPKTFVINNSRIYFNYANV